MPPNSFPQPGNYGQPSEDTDGLAAAGDNPAVDMIRERVSAIYEAEPDATRELQEAESSRHRSKHQQFMHELSQSGKDIATIQTEWHNYYQNLSPSERHQVWHEFYASQSAVTVAPEKTQAPTPPPQKLAEHKHEARSEQKAKKRAIDKQKKLRDVRSTQEVRQVIRDKVSAGGKLEAKHHVQSLLFGLGMGCIVLLIFLFSFFNEVIIAPFIQPGRAQASTPLIVSSNTVAVSAEPQVIIPKINVQIPVDYTQTSIEDSAIESALDKGVVHYPTTVKPGETGNAAFFGHSSNNIFNKGKYKFAFVMLHQLVEGDTFYLNYNGKTYVYKVVSKKVVSPSEVGVLGPVPGYSATATLITCDPPGTSLNRLIVVGEQISPDPSGNVQAAAPTESLENTSSNLPGNGPTLLGRAVRSTIGKIVLTIAILLAGFVILKRLFQVQKQA
jgi:sortase A